MRTAFTILGIGLGCMMGYLSAHYFALWGGIALIGEPGSPARDALVPGHIMLFASIFGLIGYLFGGDNSGENNSSIFDTRVECPHCSEAIKPTAKVCIHCNRDIPVEFTEQIIYKYTCPSCNKVLCEGLCDCPYCKTALYVCNGCNCYVLKEDKSCPKCGGLFN